MSEMKISLEGLKDALGEDYRCEIKQPGGTGLRRAKSRANHMLVRRVGFCVSVYSNGTVHIGDQGPLPHLQSKSFKVGHTKEAYDVLVSWFNGAILALGVTGC